jgi:hypothetical protein
MQVIPAVKGKIAGAKESHKSETGSGFPASGLVVEAYP